MTGASSRYKFEDYSLDIDFQDPLMLRVTKHPNQFPWRASFHDWPPYPYMTTDLEPGWGMTKSEAIDNLRKNFDMFCQTGKRLPKPGKSYDDWGFASESQIEKDSIFRIFVKIFDGNFGDRGFYRHSTIADWFSKKEQKAVLSRIKQFWNIEIKNPKTKKMNQVFGQIAKKFPFYETAFIGIFWYFNQIVIGNFFHIADGYRCGSLFGPTHENWMGWEIIQSNYPEYSTINARGIPQGRVLFDFEKNCFVIVSSSEVVSNNEAMASIIKAFRIPGTSAVNIETDPLYGPFPTLFSMGLVPMACREGKCSGAQKTIVESGILEPTTALIWDG